MQLLLSFLKMYFTELQLIYNALLSLVQQSDSVIHIYICIYIHTYIHIYIHTLFFIFFSIMVYYRLFNIVPCAIQQDLYPQQFFIHSTYNSLHLLIPNSQSIPPLLPSTWFLMLFLFFKKVVLDLKIKVFIIWITPKVDDLAWERMKLFKSSTIGSVTRCCEINGNKTTPKGRLRLIYTH